MHNIMTNQLSVIDYQLPDAPVLDLHEDVLRLEVSFTIRQQLGQIEERDALCEELCDHTA